MTEQVRFNYEEHLHKLCFDNRIVVLKAKTSNGFVARLHGDSLSQDDEYPYESRLSAYEDLATSYLQVDTEFLKGNPNLIGLTEEMEFVDSDGQTCEIVEIIPPQGKKPSPFVYNAKTSVVIQKGEDIFTVKATELSKMISEAEISAPKSEVSNEDLAASFGEPLEEVEIDSLDLEDSLAVVSSVEKTNMERKGSNYSSQPSLF